MQTHIARMSLLPSALVLADLLAGHGGNPPCELFEQAGFDCRDIERYLQRRAARPERCSAPACA
jgi:hypothetical protein